MPITNVAQKISSFNMMTSTRFIALLPMKQLFPELQSKNVAFNLTSYSLPEMRVSTADVQYLGYSIEVPTAVRTQDKSVTFEYLISSDWSTYKMLAYWMQKVTKEEGVGAGYDNLDEICLPVTVIMLSEFKKPVLSVRYDKCWLKSFGEVRLDYQDSEAAVIKHSFTLSYAFYSINDPTEAGVTI